MEYRINGIRRTPPRELSKAAKVQGESIKFKSLIQEISLIYSTLLSRWQTYCQAKTKDPIRARALALKPCIFLDRQLSALVGLVLTDLTKLEFDNMMNHVESHPQLKICFDDLRKISLHTEEAMEQDALQSALQACLHPKFNVEFDRYFKQGVNSQAKQMNSAHTQITLLKAVIVKIPRHLKETHPGFVTATVFKYFENYVHLVKAELKLLRSALKMTDSSLLQLSFIQIGSGFPLSGLLLHMFTGGARVTLIDKNFSLVEQVQKLIDVLESMNVIQRGSIKIICGDALDFEYVASAKLEKVDGTSESHERTLKADVLDIASSISSDITKEIFLQCVHGVPFVRKRNVKGLSCILYEQFKPCSVGEYVKVSTVVPPKDFDKCEHEKIVGLLDHCNLCSCDLFARKNA